MNDICNSIFNHFIQFSLFNDTGHHRGQRENQNAGGTGEPAEVQGNFSMHPFVI